MKKPVFMAAIFFLAAFSVYGQSRVSLDEAIQRSSLQIQNSLREGLTVIVYQFQSRSPRLSDYVLKDLFDKLVNSQQFTVLDRTAQEVINAELNFQFNVSDGMISDASLASLTNMIGAAAIVTGSLDDTGDEYRFRIRVIGTETAAAIASYTIGVNKKDRQISALAGRRVSAGNKIGTGALNILFGLGSYIEGDAGGGITVTVGHALAASLMIIEAAALDRDSPAAGVPGTIGFVTAGVSLVYGFVRPFIYNRSPKTAAVFDNTKPGIVLTRDKHSGNGNLGFQLTHTIKF